MNDARPDDPAHAWFALFDKGHQIAAYKGFSLVGCNGDGLKIIHKDPHGKVARFIRKQLKLVCRCVRVDLSTSLLFHGPCMALF